MAKEAIEQTRGGLHTQRAAPFLPPSTRQPRLAWIVLAAAVVVFAGLQVLGENAPGARPPDAAAAPEPPAAQAPPPAVQPAPPVQPPVPAAGVTEAASRRNIVTKCVEDGTTTFSDRPCAPGARTQKIPVDPDQNMSQGLLPSQIDLSAPKEPPAPAGAAADSSTATLRKHRCEALQANIKAIDEAARQLLPAPEQDRLAALRREYRSAQFRLRC